LGKSSADSQRHAGIPNALASFTKSGLPKSNPKCRPSALSYFHTSEPYCLFSHTTVTKRVFTRTAVSSSWQLIKKPLLPLTATTLRFRWTSLAAIAGG
jgi:hypothetical protein